METGTPLEVAVSMSRLLRPIEYLIHAFASETLDCLWTLTSHLNSRASASEAADRPFQAELSSSLSGAETARLYRAFLLLQNLSRLFYEGMPFGTQSNFDITFGELQALMISLFSRFVDWDIEELACIYDFCLRALTRKSALLGEHYMQSRLAEGPYGKETYQAVKSVPHHSGKVASIHLEEDIVETPRCFRGRVWIFSHISWNHRRSLVDSLICCGTPVISHVLRSEIGRPLMRMISANAGPSHLSLLS